MNEESRRLVKRENEKGYGDKEKGNVKKRKNENVYM